jgi:hypothetical protein
MHKYVIRARWIYPGLHRMWATCRAYALLYKQAGSRINVRRRSCIFKTLFDISTVKQSTVVLLSRNKTLCLTMFGWPTQLVYAITSVYTLTTSKYRVHHTHSVRTRTTLFIYNCVSNTSITLFLPMKSVAYYYVSMFLPLAGVRKSCNNAAGMIFPHIQFYSIVLTVYCFLIFLYLPVLWFKLLIFELLEITVSNFCYHRVTLFLKYKIQFISDEC